MNIKKQLKNGAKQVLPDEKLKEQIKYRMGIDGCEAEAELGGIKALVARRKGAVIAGACVLAAAITVCAFIPVMTRKDSPIDIPPAVIQLSSSEQVYGFSAATAGIVIAGIDDAARAASAYRGTRAKAAFRGLGDRVDDEQTITLINGYMELVESFISGEKFTVTGSENVNAEFGEYDFVMNVSYTDMLGNARESGTIYYNRTHLGTEYDDGETESEYTLDGVMVIGENRYPLRGTHEEESEDDESEAEYEMRVYLGENSYILVEQSYETEDDEQETEYSYTYIERGRKVSRTTFEYEREENETELLMTVEESGKEPEIFSFESEDGEIVIRLEGAAGDVVYNVRIEGGQYVYYREGEEIKRGDRDD